MLRDDVLPHLPEARKSASKKAVDGVEAKLCRIVNPANGRLPTPPNPRLCASESLEPPTSASVASPMANGFVQPPPTAPPTAPPTESGTPNSVATPACMHPEARRAWDEEQLPLSLPIGGTATAAATECAADKWRVQSEQLERRANVPLV